MELYLHKCKFINEVDEHFQKRNLVVAKCNGRKRARVCGIKKSVILIREVMAGTVREAASRAERGGKISNECAGSIPRPLWEQLFTFSRALPASPVFTSQNHTHFKFYLLITSCNFQKSAIHWVVVASTLVLSRIGQR